MAGKQGGKGRGVVIKKEEVVEGGHHGGAWKVAYADFVTAMMAFFLLMWLLNATTEEQRRGLADYFTPTNVMSQGSSGSGRIFGGRTPYERGEMVSDRGAKSVMPGQAEQVNDQDDPEYDQAPNASTRGAAEDQRRPEGNRPDPGGTSRTARDQATQGAGTREAGGGTATTAAATQAQALGQAQRLANAGAGTNAATPTVLGRPIDDAAMRAELERRERENFEQAAEQIREAVRSDPALQELVNQLAIDQTPEGMRIQLLDEDRTPMFASGSAELHERARALLLKVAPVIARMNQRLSIAGHTDATPFRGSDRSNWELSAERANATRRLLVEQGIAESRLRSVTGNADRDPLLPADPFAAVNRRIAITVLRETRGSP
jgi:chemotaxis protein MotB